MREKFQETNTMQDDPGKQLEFPLDCQFRIMAMANAENIPQDLQKVIDQHDLKSTPKKGNSTKKGTYQSWIVSGTIYSLESLRAVGADFSAIDGVKMVL
ncbi:DUF493 domain-containing protein [Lentisphaera araneosa]|nr:DUF493 domain-containing protein [Lentisphaera araneosa]